MVNHPQRNKAQEFEGNNIIRELLPNVNVDDIADDKITRGRIRSIYTQSKYGSKRVEDIAKYYDLPVQLIKDIRDKKAFRKITEDL